MNIIVTYLALLLGAILGDTANYWIGHKIGPKVFSNNNSKIFKKEYLIKTTEFYEKHGGKTIILARFFPIIRTFAPFVAGVGKMHYDTFIKYNIVGGFLWVTLFTFAGYFFGGLPIIQKNFHYAVVGIIVVSLFPMFYEFINHKRNAKKTAGKKADYKDIEETLKKAHLND
jgi:membrane-associated protein